MKFISMVFLLSGLFLLGCQSTKQESNIDKQTKFIENFASLPIADAHPGYLLFNQNGCIVCHGTKLQGSKIGPPLLMNLYKRSHHNDQRLFESIKFGVAKHHWEFGDMPAHPHIQDSDIQLMVDFIRQSLLLNDIN